MDGNTKPIERHLTRAEAAAYLHLATHTLGVWATKGCGPVYLKLGRAVRYRQTDLDAYLAGCEVHPDTN